MAYTPFTSNYDDISNDLGYQFEFRCDVCQNGFKSEFSRSALGTAGSVLESAGGFIGGLFGASDAARGLKDLTDQGARDAALKKASEEIMPQFRKCPRDNSWVDADCWNDERGLCTSCAPRLAAELEATRAEVEIEQMREAVSSQKVFDGDTSVRATECPSCGAPVGDGRFCQECGTALARGHCTQCGEALPPGAKFCGGCGAKAG